MQCIINSLFQDNNLMSFGSELFSASRLKNEAHTFLDCLFPLACLLRLSFDYMHASYDSSIRTVSRVDDAYGPYGSYEASHCVLLC